MLEFSRVAGWVLLLGRITYTFIAIDTQEFFPHFHHEWGMHKHESAEAEDTLDGFSNEEKQAELLVVFFRTSKRALSMSFALNLQDLQQKTSKLAS